MDLINQIIANTNNYQVIVLMVLLALSLTWCIILTIQISRMNSKYKKFMRGTTPNNIEQLVLNQMDRVENAVNRVDMLNGEFINLKNQVDKCLQKHNIVRYNAFSDAGSDLSYSIAMMDNFNNGFIITGIYGRNESVTYAKPIENGESKYPLSNEEELVLKRSLKRIEK